MSVSTCIIIFILLLLCNRLQDSTGITQTTIWYRPSSWDVPSLSNISRVQKKKVQYINTQNKVSNNKVTLKAPHFCPFLSGIDSNTDIVSRHIYDLISCVKWM